MSYRQLPPDEAKKLLDGGEGWRYVDVRTVEEFAAGHPTGAYNVPIAIMDGGRMLPNPRFASVVQKHFPRDSKLILGCASGPRSARACETLAGCGYTNLVNMHGGLHGVRDMLGRTVAPGWLALGYPVAATPDPDKSYDALQR